jgi:pimeloyl-ACP methyl ester carboxylesterase
MRTIIALSVAALLVGCASTRSVERPRPAGTEQTLRIELDGEATPIDVYTPSSARARAVVVLAHGFGRDRSTLAELARDLSDAGFAVVVPDLPALADHGANARFLTSLANEVEQSSRPALAFGASRIIFVGFSAGGLASLVAASARGDTAAWIGLDPVDRDGLGVASAGQVTAAAFVIRAGPSACNAESNIEPALLRLPRLALDRVESGASHCDFEAPTDRLCTLACGPATPERQRAIRAFVVAVARSIPSR